ncbi:uncharacterized protein LOC125763441 isoform X2 [Anopheles funestus]|uniref:uncharacterized protein LOC125763441 isoform X2 n=1 Tax=Anopheles funestus TaxID=62324 RepID=UPI0020C5E5BC|nr:uncharacterized protein LOC125763441 isoform X2 [Anopheles funestus]
MPHVISRILLLNLVFFVLCISDCIVSEPYTERLRIFGPRIVPEYSALALECEAAVHDVQNESVNWYFSDNMNPLNTNMLNTTINGKSVLQIKSVLRQQTNIFYCCLGNSTTICATHSVIVLYTTLDQHIMRLNDASGVLLLTQSPESPPKQYSHLGFALCLRYRWQLENVEIISSFDTVASDSFYNDSIEEENDDKHLWKHIYYNVEYNALNGNRFFEIKFTNNVSHTTYYLYLSLNGAVNCYATRHDSALLTRVFYIAGKPKPKMDDMIFLSDAEMIELRCWGIAIPVPKVTISFTPCPSLEWNNCNKSTVTLAESISYSSSTCFFNESVQVPGQYLTSGIVHCTATNTEGTSCTRSKLLQRNQRDVMMLLKLRPSTVIYTGDSITVQCFVDRYNFTNSFTFRAKNERHKVLGQQDNFNWVANFTVNNLTIHDNEIECQSMHNNGTLVKKVLNFTIVRPYINAQQTVRHVIAKSDIPLLLTCNATGRPVLQYRWLKNDLQLPNTNFMIVINASEDDEFDCYASNRAGEVRLRWVISNSTQASIDFTYQLAQAVTLFLVVTMGLVWCYFIAEELCTLIKLQRAIRNRELYPYY